MLTFKICAYKQDLIWHNRIVIAIIESHQYKTHTYPSRSVSRPVFVLAPDVQDGGAGYQHGDSNAHSNVQCRIVRVES